MSLITETLLHRKLVSAETSPASALFKEAIRNTRICIYQQKGNEAAGTKCIPPALYMHSLCIQFARILTLTTP
jgi:hypothetical protein